MTPLDQADIDAYVEKLRERRRARGLPEHLDSPRLHRIVAAVLASHAEKARRAP